MHALYAAGGAAVEPLRRAFGPEVIDEGGGVDRRALGALVVGNDAAMKTLEVRRAILWFQGTDCAGTPWQPGIRLGHQHSLPVPVYPCRLLPGSGSGDECQAICRHS